MCLNSKVVEGISFLELAYYIAFARGKFCGKDTIICIGRIKMARKPPPSVLLIGSWKHDTMRDIRGEGGKRVSRKVDKKSGIKRVKKKNGEDVPPEEWVKGDLRNMENYFGKKRGFDLFDTMDYREIKQDGEYSDGKAEVLRSVGEFFAQDDTSEFILYFSGHGDENGSWSFAVTTLKERNGSEPTGAEPTATGSARPGSTADGASYYVGSASAREAHAEVHVEGSGTAEEITGGGGATISQNVHRAEVDNEGGSCGTAEEIARGTEEDVTEASQTPPPRRKDTSSQTTNDALAKRLRPLPTKQWYDVVTYDDIVRVWDENKKGRQRCLMMILDCCHAGMWVQKVNGEPKPQSQVSAVGGEATAGPGTNVKRSDICIQAACRPVEESKVAKNQLYSVFTREFIAAQTRPNFEKFIFSLLDHGLVLNWVSTACFKTSFTPICSEFAPFGGIKFFNSFDDMNAQT